MKKSEIDRIRDLLRIHPNLYSKTDLLFDASSKNYTWRLKSIELKDKLCFGFDEITASPVVVDPVNQPGALYVGGMGSGKSISARFTIITRLLSNSEHDVFILIDPLKGMLDYGCISGLTDNVAMGVGSTSKMIKAIEMIHDEMARRKCEFYKVNAKNIYEYESIIRRKDPEYKLARIFLCMEEFHSVPVSLNVAKDADIAGTVSYALKDISLAGSAYGINLIAMAQRCTPSDFPSCLGPGVTQPMVFRVNNPGDAAAVNLPQSFGIGINERGRCSYAGGIMQFPFLSEEVIKELINKHYRPLDAELLVHGVDEYRLRLG